LVQLQENSAGFRRLGYELVGICPDRQELIASWMPEHKVEFANLSDQDLTAGRAFGLAFQLDAASVEKYRGVGLDIEAASGRVHHLLPVPAIYVLDQSGQIRFVYASVDHRVRLPAKAILKAAKTAIE
jgi:peroxiredoxin